MVLITGPAGSGKSTTLACIVDQINETKEGHIITLEDPIDEKSSSPLFIKSPIFLSAKLYIHLM